MSIYSVSCFGGIGWTCVPAVKKCLNITLVKATGLAVNSLVNFIKKILELKIKKENFLITTTW